MPPIDSLSGARECGRPAPSHGAVNHTTTRRDFLKRSATLAAGMLATGPISSALASATRPSGRAARPPGQPNILIIMTDQMRTPR